MLISGERGQTPLNFDPLLQLHPRQRHGNLAWVPNGSDPAVHLIRWYPSEGDPATRDRLQSVGEGIMRIRHRERHLQMLQTIGDIVVPRHVSFLGLEETGVEPALTIYTLVENITYPQTITAKGKPGGAELHSALLKYYAWVATTEEPVIFGELFHPSQFCVTKGPGEDERHLTLLDLDCRQMPVNEVNMASARARLGQLRQSFDDRIA